MRSPLAAYGKTKYTCTQCGDSYTVANIKPKGHSYKSQLTKATTAKDGQIYKKCSVCGAVTGKTVIAKVSNIKLNKTAYTYNGKAQRPGVTVKNSKGKALKNGTDYTVSYPKGMKNVGKYTVKVTLKGNYSGSKSMTYNINPKGTSVSKVKAAKKGFKTLFRVEQGEERDHQEIRKTGGFSPPVCCTLHKILHSGGQVVNNITNLQTETNFFLQYRGKSAIIVSVKISDFSKKTD